MNIKGKSNEKLNNHKIETNELIRPIDDLIQSLKKVNKAYYNIDNIVITYRDKIYEIYTNLAKQNIDFWNNDFLLSDAIMRHLDSKVYEGIDSLLSFSTEISKKNMFIKQHTRPTKKEIIQLEKIKSINNYIKTYEIDKNLYETLKEYYTNIQVSALSPKDVTFSYIIIKACLKDIKMDNILSENEEKEIVKIIEKRELECLEYRKKFNEVLDLLKKMYNIDEKSLEKIELTRIKNI